MSLLSKIRAGLASLFGESDDAVKATAVKLVEKVAEEHIPEGVEVLSKFFASKGVVLEADVLTEAVTLILKGGESLLQEEAK